MRAKLSLYGLAINRHAGSSYPHTDNMPIRNDLAMTFAENLQKVMDYHELSQAALAKRSGVGQSTLSKILNTSDPENMNPRASTIQQLADFFGVPGWQLLVPHASVDDLLTRKRDARQVGGGAPAVPSPADGKLLETAIQTAMEAFNAKSRTPTYRDLAAAARFVYDRISSGRRLKEAERAVGDFLSGTMANNASSTDATKAKGKRQLADND